MNHSERRRYINNNNTESPIRLKFPFIDKTFETEVRRQLRILPLPGRIQPIFVTERPLCQLLVKSNVIPCGVGCVCDGRNICMSKNIVYKICCLICQQFYIGETHRTLITRIMEHIKHSTSNVHKHFTNHHNCSPSLRKIKFHIVSQNFHNTLHRKSFEYTAIKKFKPHINIQNI